MHGINVVKHIFPFMPPIDVHVLQIINSCKLTMYTFFKLAQISPSYIQSMNKDSIIMQYLIGAFYAI